ncbi:MAG: Hpt domain-containing protein [Lachnospiraceae bacterium]|nr:Hpt domain-containing protein [Lachnospiraceae bacterium]
MGYDFGWLEEIGIDINEGIGYTGGEDKYISALQRFCKSHEKNEAKISEYYSAKDFESYMITVHALKSNAKMIGAKNLSDLFAKLEAAAREGQTDVIERLNSGTVTAYSVLVEKLGRICDMGDVKAAGEISAEEARETADALLEALDDFDDELSKELIYKLSGYPFRITQREKLKEAVGYVEDFLYDEAAEVIRDILPGIE